ncbi:MAG: glycosyltransferase, partial [Gemmatimonadaceae bacterium]
RWLLAVDTTAELKRQGRRPLLVARGGMEAHGGEVLQRMRADGLRVIQRPLLRPGEEGLIDAARDTDAADVVLLTTPLDRAASQLLFAASTAVLANSGHEPFGLVGLEAMAAGGVACVGGTGEDYVVPGRNALVLQTTEPREVITEFERWQRHPEEARALRHQALTTARWFAWSRIVRRDLLPRLFAAETRGVDDGAATVRAWDLPVASAPVAHGRQPQADPARAPRKRVRQPGPDGRPPVRTATVSQAVADVGAG